MIGNWWCCESKLDEHAAAVRNFALWLRTERPDRWDVGDLVAVGLDLDDLPAVLETAEGFGDD